MRPEEIREFRIEFALQHRDPIGFSAEQVGHDENAVGHGAESVREERAIDAAACMRIMPPAHHQRAEHANGGA